MDDNYSQNNKLKSQFLSRVRNISTTIKVLIAIVFVLLYLLISSLTNFQPNLDLLVESIILIIVTLPIIMSIAFMLRAAKKINNNQIRSKAKAVIFVTLATIILVILGHIILLQEFVRILCNMFFFLGIPLAVYLGAIVGKTAIYYIKNKYQVANDQPMLKANILGIFAAICVSISYILIFLVASFILYGQATILSGQSFIYQKSPYYPNAPSISIPVIWDALID